MPDADTQAEQRQLERARAGDEAAFRTLCERHGQALRAAIRQRLAPALRRKVSASDVLQEAYVVVWQRLGDFEDRGPGSFGRWLSRIVELKTREAIERYAGTAKRAAGAEVSRSASRSAQAVARTGSPSQMAMAGEMRERVRAALKALPEDYRIVLELLQEQQVEVVEAARRMGRSENAVRKLYGRALERLASQLGLKA